LYAWGREERNADGVVGSPEGRRPLRILNILGADVPSALSLQLIISQIPPFFFKPEISLPCSRNILNCSPERGAAGIQARRPLTLALPELLERAETLPHVMRNPRHDPQLNFLKTCRI
jgi:hypothetical protein